MILNPLSIFIIEKEGYRVLNLDTINHILGSFYSFGYKILEQGQDYLYGKSYLEYFFRLTPSIFRQGIPLKYALEWHTHISDYIVAEGGNLEIAEAFYNFGLLGVILVSLFTSSLLIFIAKQASKNIAFMVLFLTLGFESVRYIWYQYFAFFIHFSLSVSNILI